MKVIKDKIGDTAIFLQILDEDLVIVNDENEEGPALVETGIGDQLKRTYPKIKSVVKDLAQDIGEEVKKISAPIRPKQIEMEFSLILTAKGVIWILSGEGQLRVKMIWELQNA